MTSSWYKDHPSRPIEFHYNDKTAVIRSYSYNGNLYDKTVSWYLNCSLIHIHLSSYAHCFNRAYERINFVSLKCFSVERNGNLPFTWSKSKEVFPRRGVFMHVFAVCVSIWLYCKMAFDRARTIYTQILEWTLLTFSAFINKFRVNRIVKR